METPDEWVERNKELRRQKASMTKPIPVDKYGNIQTHTVYTTDHYFEAEDFTAELRFSRRDGPRVWWKDDTGREYPMFMSVLIDFLSGTECDIYNGVTGNFIWTWVHKGEYWSIVPVMLVSDVI